MSDVFISYSRKDKAFVQKLYEALRSQERETWVDWEAIEWTEDWWQAIERGIEGTNTFVFVISPDSVTSRHCNAEIDHAVQHNKRLVPVVYREVEADQVHEALGKLNWLFFRDTDPFEVMFGELVDAIETDLEYVQAHTRLEVRAIEWNHKNRNESFVLRGDDLKAAECWLAQGKQPKPTELQRDYVRASQVVEEATRILIEAGQKAEQLVQEAKAATRIERAGAVALRRFDSDQSGGLRLAMMAGFELQKWVRGKSIDQYPALSPILALQSGLERIRETKLPGNQGRVLSVTFSPDGKHLATGGSDGTTKLWDKDGKLSATLNGSQGRVLSVTFSPDGKHLATGGSDGTTKLWNENGQIITTLNGSQGRILSVAFSPDGKHLATGGDDGTTKLWNENGQMITTLNSDQTFVSSVAFSPDGKRIATGGGGATKLWDKSGEFITMLNQAGTVYSVAFSPDGKLIATGEWDGSIKLWDKDGKLITTLNSNQSSVYSVAFSSDSKRIATGGRDGTTKIWDRDDKPINTFNSNRGSALSVAFSPDGRLIATGEKDGNTKLWDRDGKLITTLNGNQGGVGSVEFSPDSKYIATGGKDGNTKLWDKDGKLIATINGNQIYVWRVAFSPDGKLIVTSGDDGTIKLWDKDGNNIAIYGEKQGGVWSLAFSPDGRLIATGGDDSTIELWDKDGNNIITFNGNQGRIWSLAFSPDGKLIATGGDDSTTRIWDKDGKTITTLNGDQGGIWSLAFSTDGKLITTTGVDTTKLWDTNGNQVGQFESGSVALSPDWQIIAIISKPTYFGAPLPDSKQSIVTLHRIDLDLDSLLRRACQHLKPYILSDRNQKTEQAQCEAHLGENWEAERIAK